MSDRKSQKQNLNFWLVQTIIRRSSPIINLIKYIYKAKDDYFGNNFQSVISILHHRRP